MQTPVASTDEVLWELCCAHLAACSGAGPCSLAVLAKNAVVCCECILAPSSSLPESPWCAHPAQWRGSSSCSTTSSGGRALRCAETAAPESISGESSPKSGCSLSVRHAGWQQGVLWGRRDESESSAAKCDVQLGGISICCVTRWAWPRAEV